MYYCFGCGAGGNVYNFIMEYENYSFGEALSHLADRAGVELPKIEYSREAREKHNREQIFWRSTSWQHSIFIISSGEKAERRLTDI